VLTRPGRLPDRHPPLPSDQSLNPATTSHHAGLSFTGHQQGFNHVHPSGLPLAHAAGVEPATLRLSLSFAPRRYRRRTSGRGQAIEHGPGTTAQLIASISNPVVHSMRATSRRTANRRCVATRGARPASVLAGVSWPRRRGCSCPEAATRAALSVLAETAASRRERKPRRVCSVECPGCLADAPRPGWRECTDTAALGRAIRLYRRRCGRCDGYAGDLPGVGLGEREVQVRGVLVVPDRGTGLDACAGEAREIAGAGVGRIGCGQD